MKITKAQLKQIIKEELEDPIQLSPEDSNRFTNAYSVIERSDLPSEVKDAVFDMLSHLGIHL
jgi:hypothetical protein